MPAPITFEQFKARSIEVHGNLYDYSLADFKGTKKEVLLVCLKHNEKFLQRAETHMRGQKGCPSCSGRYSSTEAWVESARQLNGGPWDYTKATYVNNTTPVLLGCPEHGEFEQLPKTHIRGAVGCPRCGRSTPLTQKTFETKVKEVFGDRWDLSEAEYTTNSSKVRVGCREHGTFEQVPMSMFAGKVGCPKCNFRRASLGASTVLNLGDLLVDRQAVIMAVRGKKVAPEEFISRSREVWGGRWDYSDLNFLGMAKPVQIICPLHGPYSQRASSHLAGELGCSSCRGVISDTSSFIAKASDVWGDRWDYSNTEYQKSRTPVTIRCREHGEFTQSVAYHIQGRVGCKSCSGQAISQEEFLRRSHQTWGDRWDMSKAVYHNWTSPLRLECREHGEFLQDPAPFFRGQVGCNLCQGRVDTLDKFILRSQEVYGEGVWEYSETDYVGSKTPLTITCPEHGNFSQIPTSHLRGSIGCSSCAGTQTSKGEKELLDFIQSLNQEVLPNRRGLIEGNKEVDIYIPETRLALEYNGLYYHSELFLDRTYHRDKARSCAAAGIRLIQIWEDQWRDRPEAVREKIRRQLGVSTQPKVSGRETHLEYLSHAEASSFLDKHHIQGKASGSLRLGLRYKDELVAVAVFKKEGDDLLLSRYATSAMVRGGHSKIIAHVERTQKYQGLITFADLMISDGGLYESTGWSKVETLDPDYFYVRGNERFHKFNFRRKKFETDPSLKYVPYLSEGELARLNGLYRVYDAGKVKYCKKNPATDTKDGILGIEEK